MMNVVGAHCSFGVVGQRGDVGQAGRRAGLVGALVIGVTSGLNSVLLPTMASALRQASIWPFLHSVGSSLLSHVSTSSSRQPTPPLALMYSANAVDRVDVALEQARGERRAGVGHHLDGDLAVGHADLGRLERLAGALLLDVGGGERVALVAALGRCGGVRCGGRGGTPRWCRRPRLRSCRWSAGAVVSAGAAVVSALGAVVAAVVVSVPESSLRPQAVTRTVTAPRHANDRRSFLIQTLVSFLSDNGFTPRERESPPTVGAV